MSAGCWKPDFLSLLSTCHFWQEQILRFQDVMQYGTRWWMCCKMSWDFFVCDTYYAKIKKMVGSYNTCFFGIRHMWGNQRSFWVNLCSFWGTNMRVPDFDVCWLCSPGQHAKKGGSRNLMVDVQPPFFGVSRKPRVYILYKYIQLYSISTVVKFTRGKDAQRLNLLNWCQVVQAFQVLKDSWLKGVGSRW